MVVWNEVDERGIHDFSIRAYTDRLGLGQVLGYVSYPKKDNRGFYFRTEYLGRNGVEAAYDEEVMADGHEVDIIESYNNDDRLPFLNKVISGAYTPGSIVKPFVAYAALAEDIIDPMKEIVSTGEIVIPNPYNPSNPAHFTDWRAHGVMTMREAIAFSSNVYFYIIGGGYGDQKGLGITKMAEYFRLFGLGSLTGINIAQEQAGVVPDPAWKQEVFEDDWRLGDTYFTAIGQFGFLTTPIQMLRAYSAIANGG